MTTFSEAMTYGDVTETWEDGRFFNNCGEIRVVVYKRQRFVMTRNPYIWSRERVTLADLKDAGFSRVHIFNHGIGTAVKAEMES